MQHRCRVRIVNKVTSDLQFCTRGGWNGGAGRTGVRSTLRKLVRTRGHAQTIQIYPSSRDLHPKSYITYRESRMQAAQEEMANHNRNLILGIHVRYTPLPPPLPPPILLRLLVCDVSHPSTNLIHALSPPQSLSFVICNRSRCQTRTRVYTPASTRTRCEDEH